MTKIITVTPNPALDVNTVADKIEPGEKIRCESISREVGGGGINVSRALRRLEIESTAIFVRGGTIGDLYQELLNDEDFDQHHIQTSSNTRENLSVKSKEDDKMYRFVLPGAEVNHQVAEDIINALKEYKEAEIIVASGSLPPGMQADFYAQVAEYANDNDIKFILDTSKKPLKEAIQKKLFLIKPNEKELEQLVDQKLNSKDERLAAATELYKQLDVENIVVSLGDEGALLINDDLQKHLPVPEIKEVKSAVGAGDSMVAGIVAALFEGKEIEEAVKFGLASGSAALLTPGTELLKKDDAERLFKEI